MDKKYLESLINKFEKSLNETEKMSNSLIYLGTVLSNLDKSISKVDESMVQIYKVNEIDNIAERSIDEISGLQILKRESIDILDVISKFKNIQADICKVQSSVSYEYNKLINLNAERLNLKNELEDFKIYIENMKLDINQNLKKLNTDISTDIMKMHRANLDFKKELITLNENNNNLLKEEILNSIKDLLDIKDNSKETNIQSEVSLEFDEDNEIERFKKMAGQGNALAQYNLGLYYASGEEVDKDYKEVVKWYTKAAKQGYAKAQYNLGICYDKGYGVKRDYKEAVKWYTKAAKQSHVNAQRILGMEI